MVTGEFASFRHCFLERFLGIRAGVHLHRLYLALSEPCGDEIIFSVRTGGPTVLRTESRLPSDKCGTIHDSKELEQIKELVPCIGGSCNPAAGYHFGIRKCPSPCKVFLYGLGNALAGQPLPVARFSAVPEMGGGS